MSLLPPTGDAPLPSPLARRVNEACDRFEAAWKAGPRPHIEAYLEGVVGPQRPALLRELVLLDADYRRLAGEDPRPEEYRARFPDLDPAWLGAALASPPAQAITRVPFIPAADAPTLIQHTSPGGKDEPEELPAAIGSYRLVRRLGSGGMGTVFEAEETATGRRVALKILAPELADSADAIARFRAEGRLASAITHPRCVFVLAADEDAGRPYIVMELMPGDTLADLVKRGGPLAPQQAVAHILDVIDGLQEAHRAGVIHRDVKPSNCFLTADGRVKVGDFGLAKSLARGANLTRTGTFLGTPLFASPEQIKGQAVDARTDVYSIAATLYFLLTGQAPFEGGDAMAVMARIVSEPAPPVRGQRPDVPPGLERVLLRGLERDRERRPKNLEEFRLALLPFAPQQLLAGTPGWRLGAHILDGFLFTWFGADTWIFTLLVDWGVLSIPEGKQVYFLAWSGLWILYFTILEGLWGWSLGKLLFGLRVCAAEGGEPPGLARALLRSVAHFTIVYLAGTALQFVGYANPEEWWWSVGDLIATVVGATLLLTTVRRRNGYRGPHELLSGTRVVMLPGSESETLPGQRQPARSVREGARPADAPECLGPFAIHTALRWTSDQKILTGKDPALDRTAWIELRPLTAASLPVVRRDLQRPGRLRWLGGGVQGPWQWDAFLAPTGVPAAAIVAGGRPLRWHQARPLLEQLTEELGAACADGTLPLALSPDQVWIRPGGLVLLLDTPPAAPEAPPQDQPAADQDRALALLRQTVVLLLDHGGTAPVDRPSLLGRLALWALTLGLMGAAAVVFFEGPALLGGGLLLLGVLLGIQLVKAVRAKLAYARKNLIRSPLPGHADVLLGRLLSSGQQYASVAEVRAELDATRNRPARVTTKLRLAHLAILGTLLAPGLLLMFILARSLNGMAITVLVDEIPGSEKALRILDSGRLREFVHANMGRDSFRKVPTGDPTEFEMMKRDAIVRRFSDPELRRRLASLLQRERSNLKGRLEAVNFLERSWLGDYLKEPEKFLNPDPGPDLKGFELRDFLKAAHAAELKTRQPELPAYGTFGPGGPDLVESILAMVVVWPACWILWPLLWRGGLTQRALGLSLVMASGHRALRLQCAWRALVVWAPVATLVCLSVCLEAYYPELIRWSWTCWGAALAFLLVFAGLALRSPARGLHDRLAGTYLVPR